MSTYLKLTLSYIKPSLGCLDDVTATNGTAFASAPEPGSVCSDVTYTDGVISTSAPDHISNLGTIFASVPEMVPASS